MSMKRNPSDIRGQGLLETIVALGVILAGTIGTISLLIATMNAGRASVNTEIATNLAREAVEVARNIRDSNWLKIQANEDQVYDLWADPSTLGVQLAGTFDGLFNDTTKHHVRFPVFYRYRNYEEFYSYGKFYTNNTWVMADTDDFMNFVGPDRYRDTAYSDPITYNGSDSICAYPDPASTCLLPRPLCVPPETRCADPCDPIVDVVSYPCATVFQNYDMNYSPSGYGFFNQMPEYTRPLIGLWYRDFYDYPHSVTSYSTFKRWVTFNPICRIDSIDDGIPDVLPHEPASEYIVSIDDGSVDSTCKPEDIMVGLQVIGTVTWGAQCPGAGCTCPGKDCVQVEDRLYNWKYVK